MWGCPCGCYRAQQVQNIVARLSNRVKKNHSLLPYHVCLALATCKFLCQLQDDVNIQGTNYLGHWYLTECLLSMRSARPTSQAGQLRPLIPREAQKEKTRNWASLVVAPHLWNSLSPEICLDPSLATFKQALNTWLFWRSHHLSTEVLSALLGYIACLVLPSLSLIYLKS